MIAELAFIKKTWKQLEEAKNNCKSTAVSMKNGFKINIQIFKANRRDHIYFFCVTVVFKYTTHINIKQWWAALTRRCGDNSGPRKGVLYCRGIGVEQNDGLISKDERKTEEKCTLNTPHWKSWKNLIFFKFHT